MSTPAGEDKCPVDHATREAWLAKAKQAQQAKKPANIPTPNIDNTTTTPENTWGSALGSLFWAQPRGSGSSSVQCPVDHRAPLPGHPSVEGMPEGATCPVDESAREVWSAGLRKTVTNVPEAIEVKDKSCSSDALDSTLAKADSLETTADLPEEREISSIPRTGTASNWIYPSQKQFFNAMRRKEWNPDAGDMKTIVPIHNLVNERAWSYILMWERDRGGEQCGGVQLTSFQGDSKKITPRARIRNLIFGADLPFDRHDWVVDRCGTRVEYVIDFYSSNKVEGGPSFYLDVRPKLNTWEGCKLRLLKALGM